MSHSPIPRVLSTFREKRVQALLMGGQACILYGGAEFSRDADFALLSSRENLDRLRDAMHDLEAEVIAVPPFDQRHLERGHAVHFRAHHEEASGFRIDVMSKLRGVDPFPRLWERRTTFQLGGAGDVETLSLPDLVASKKTQRDKDWVMIRRLVEASYARERESPTAEQISFWLAEARTPAILVECARTFPDEAKVMTPDRPLLASALHGDVATLETDLSAEEQRERKLDREYWAPLRAELEDMRRGRR